jgi:hypothetical protein
MGIPEMKHGALMLLTCLLACLAIDVPAAAAQPAMNEGQGHPLKGTWIGDWGPSKADRTPVVIEMNWDGKAITGSLNPGPEAIRFTKADLNPADWSVRIEAVSGSTRYTIDGKIENLGSAARSIAGTWVQGNRKGDFKIARQ